LAWHPGYEAAFGNALMKIPLACLEKTRRSERHSLERISGFGMC
jgi:hypothetical protein